jgi:hypothetical protein
MSSPVAENAGRAGMWTAEWITEPLLEPNNASVPLPRIAGLTGQMLDDNRVWAKDELKVRI